MERIPYRFGAPVDPPWFCDRQSEVDVLVSRMTAGIHAFVLSPRRYGKTSVIRQALRRLQVDGGRAAYANLLLATTETELAATILQAVARGVLSAPGRTVRSLETLLRHLRVSPSVTVATDGSVSFTLDPARVAGQWLDVVVDAVALLERAAQRRPAALVLDEFQVVAGIGKKGVAGAFKALADATTTASLVFSGSHLSVMERITKGEGAPLQGMGERIVLDVIPEPAMTEFLRRRARSAGVRLSPAAARQIYRLADAVPNYVQQLALGALEAAAGHEEITDGDVRRGLETVVERQASGFAQQFEALGSAPAQQRVLKELARRPTANVYAKSFLDAVGVANANSVTTALRVLSDKELVVRRARQWDVADPFLRRWIVDGAP